MKRGYRGYGLCVLLMVALLLAACGNNTGATGGTGAPTQDSTPEPTKSEPAKLTRLQIKTFAFGQTAPETRFDIVQQELVQKIYDTAQKLPVVDNVAARICTMQGGPGYEMIFWAGEKAVGLPVYGDESGCRDIVLNGNSLRQTDEAFWQMIHQAIEQAPSVEKPESIEIVSYASMQKAPSYVKITATEQIQKLYDALLALPFSKEPGSCPSSDTDSQARSFDDLFFFEKGNLARIQVNGAGCDVVHLFNDKDQFRQVNPEVRQLLAQIIKDAKPQPAKPDKLDIQKRVDVSNIQFTTITDQKRIQQFYDTTYALPEWPPYRDSTCGTQGPAGDFSILTYSIGDAWLITVNTFTQCEAVTFSRGGDIGGTARKINQQFFDLVQKPNP